MSVTASFRQAAAGLTGLQRAAIVLLALGDNYGRAIWEALDDDEIRALTVEMTQLGTIQAAVVENLLLDLSRQAAEGRLRGDIEGTRALLRKILPEHVVEDLIDSARGPDGRTMYQKLSNVSPTLIANFLKNEHPQTAAVVLSRLASEHTAKVIAALPRQFSEEVVSRMLTLGDVPRDILDRIDQTLRQEFIATLGRQSRRNPLERVAEVLNLMGRDDEQRLIASIERDSPETAGRVRSLMFTFDRLAEVPPGALQVIVRAVDSADLALALKGASEPVRDAVLASMTRRSAEALKSDMASLGLVRLREVDEARARIISVAKALEQRREISLTPERDDDEMVE